MAIASRVSMSASGAPASVGGCREVPDPRAIRLHRVPAALASAG
jgi:hypothetical protein